MADLTFSIGPQKLITILICKKKKRGRICVGENSVLLDLWFDKSAVVVTLQKVTNMPFLVKCQLFVSVRSKSVMVK